MLGQLILVVDDDSQVRRVVCKALQNNGFMTIEAADGQKGLNIIRQKRPCLVVLDIMMNNVDGLSVIKEMRATDIDTPVILLSAKSEDYTAVLGLTIGADDYITKPFSPSYLCAKVSALIRRNEHATTSSSSLVLGPFCMDVRAMRLYKNDEHLNLTAKECLMMNLFMENPDRVFSKESLYRRIWGEEIVDDNTIMVYIRRLRSKIEDNPKKPRYLQTVWGMGYRFTVNE